MMAYGGRVAKEGALRNNATLLFALCVFKNTQQNLQEL